jgi:hypothetical protein
MRPIDHFFSRLDKIKNADSAGILNPGAPQLEQLAGDFRELVGPALGRSTAEELFNRAVERIAGQPISSLEKIGALAAFFIGEFDDTMVLEDADWEDIRETLEEISGEIDLDTLTRLMGELVSKHKM